MLEFKMDYHCCRFSGRLSQEGPRLMVGVSSVGGLSKYHSTYLRKFRRKPRFLWTTRSTSATEVWTWLLRAEPLSRIFSTEELSHWWGLGITFRHQCLTRYSNPGPFMQQPAPEITTPLGRCNLKWDLSNSMRYAIMIVKKSICLQYS